jgi:hypothetical protein
MSDRSNNRLSARMDMDVLDDNPLRPTATKFSQRVHLRGKGFCQAGDHKAIGILLLAFIAPTQPAE